jgi:hypothetical protein
MYASYHGLSAVGYQLPLRAAPDEQMRIVSLSRPTLLAQRSLTRLVLGLWLPGAFLLCSYTAIVLATDHHVVESRTRLKSGRVIWYGDSVTVTVTPLGTCNGFSNVGTFKGPPKDCD